MPYMMEKNGVPVSLLILVLSFISSYILHLMIADLALKAGKNAQVLSCLSRFLFRGKLKTILTVIFFVLMAGVLTYNLATYISGAEEVLVSLLPVSPVSAKLLFYLAAAVVVFFGLKAVGISEKYTVMVILALVGVLTLCSFFHISHPLTLKTGTAKSALAYWGTAMFALSAFFSVPQAVDGLEGDVPKIRKAVFLGLFNNFILILVISVCALMSSTEITEVAMIGWSRGIGFWAEIVGSVFTILAMLTTYWSLSLALGEMVKEMLNLDYRLCWLLATLPSILVTLVNLSGFVDLLRTAGGLIAIIIAFMIVPAYRNARNEVDGTILGNCGGTVTQLLIIAAYLLMAIGSVVTV